MDRRQARQPRLHLVERARVDALGERRLLVVAEREPVDEAVSLVPLPRVGDQRGQPLLVGGGAGAR